MDKITFGSVFRHKDKLYVWLGSDDEIIFSALILNYDETKAAQAMSKRFDKLPSHPINSSTLLCYVILETAQFKKQAASLHNTGDHGVETGISPEGSLCEEDIKKLKDEIKRDKYIPDKLKKIVRQTVK